MHFSRAGGWIVWAAAVAAIALASFAAIVRFHHQQGKTCQPSYFLTDEELAGQVRNKVEAHRILLSANPVFATGSPIRAAFERSTFRDVAYRSEVFRRPDQSFVPGTQTIMLFTIYGAIGVDRDGRIYHRDPCSLFSRD
jgi:hypothetical protein